MNNDLFISKKTAELLVQVCQAAEEFSKLQEIEHPELTKYLLPYNESVKKGFKWFAHSTNQTEFRISITTYTSIVKFTIDLYRTIDYPEEGKDKIIAQLSKLENHLIDLKIEVSIK